MKLNHNILVSSAKPWAVQASGQPFVYFNYNPVGDNTKVYSSISNDWERNYTYDMLGRRLTCQEGGLAESYTYDGGNLSTHVQGWFDAASGPQTRTTQYRYNAHRLEKVDYEDALSTIYRYDTYGRVDSLHDESGVVCYEYGDMGEVTKETRIYALSFLTTPVALSTQFGCDSWGRVDSIVYPDGEIVKYRYGCGGQLRGVYSSQLIVNSYLDSVLYDKFGAKVSQKYGNGLKTDYTYDNLTRRLTDITTMNGNNQVASIGYFYDPVGNVTQVNSHYPWFPNTGYTEDFTYDASDQLISAAESGSGGYALDVSYGNWGRIDDYSLLHTELWSGTTTHDHRSFAYPNDPYNPQQAQTLFAPEMHNGTSDVTYSFGINGSLRKREEHSPNPCTEYYLFNSAANLKAYSYDGLDFAYYGYNAANTRTYKLSILNMNQWVNGQPQPLALQIQQAMFYPNAYLNFNQNGEYTKHYYNGSERIASRLGDVNLSIAFDYDDMLETHRAQIEERFRVDMQALFNEEVPVDNPPMLDVSSLQPTGTPDDIFYYHMNHLGNTAFVTDQNQTVTQGFLYAPFGEITTEYNANFGNNILPKYSFNAKELDEETGMYYYEARYYKPPVFTSRDPMMDQKPWLTPYHYCSNNPVGRGDPSGMLDDDYQLDSKTGSLVLVKITDDKEDKIYVDDSKEPSYSVSKGILNGKRIGEDISKKGFVVKGDKSEERKKGIDLMVFISFTCDIELSAWGYTDLKGKKVLDVARWDENTFHNSKNHFGYSGAFDGKGTREYHVHTHPGHAPYNDGYGYGEPSPNDYKNATLPAKYYIISHFQGLTQYSNLNNSPQWYAAPNDARTPKELQEYIKFYKSK